MKPAWLVVLVACGTQAPTHVTVTSSTWTDALGEFVALSGPDVSLDTGDTPTTDSDAYQIAVVDDAAIPLEGFRIDAPAETTRTWEVHAHDVLGAQYGVAAALENLGYRFRHPYDPYIPGTPGDEATPIGVMHQPQIRVRGFQLHTLHPIEAHFAMYLGNLDEAHQIIDWVVKNRGNFVQWVLLADLLDPTRGADWQAFTKQVIDDAHLRGLTVGVNIQLFGKSNLQDAYDLVDSDTDPVAGQVAARLPLITSLPWDVYDLSFGEFFDADPQAFIDAVNEVASQLRTLAPAAAAMHATIHVGATQRATYMGQDLPYYQLVKFADPTIVPEIHSVMYYDLFEDAGGAYQYNDFSESRQYLVDRLCAQQPAAYFPESAYWVAFDNSVPLFLPIYVRTRFTDLSLIRTQAAPPPCAPLDEHLIFSSGWEWSYWLHDVTALRASYEMPASPEAAIAEQYAPDLGDAAASIVSDLADEQHDALLVRRLAAYLAGRDALIDAGRMIGVISQPDRITFDDLVAATPDARLDFNNGVLGALADHIAVLDSLALRLDGLAMPGTRWANELRQGLAIDRARAKFVFAAYRTVLDHLAGNDDEGAAQDRRDAQTAFDDATAIVHDRDGDLHDPDAGSIIDGDSTNATVYGYGYLNMADTLCYWQRELDQIDGILTNTDVTPPACVL